MATLTPFDTLDDSPGEKINDIDAALAAPTETSNDFMNHGNEIYILSNGSAGTVTATVKGQKDPYGVTAADLAIAVPAGKIGMSGLLNPALFNSGGKVTVTLSATASVKHGVLRLRKVR